jgi:hypothetical protein
MSAPLCGSAREVLRALVHGLELHEVDGEWTFVGHWQAPAHLDVSSVVMRELFGLRFICRFGGSQAVITYEGGQARSHSILEAIAAASRWFSETE